VPTHQQVASLGLLLDIIGAIWVVKGMLWISDRNLAAASDSRVLAGAEPTPRPSLPEIGSLPPAISTPVALCFWRLSASMAPWRGLST
jgi:hypothetical protein